MADWGSGSGPGVNGPYGPTAPGGPQGYPPREPPNPTLPESPYPPQPGGMYGRPPGPPGPPAPPGYGPAPPPPNRPGQKNVLSAVIAVAVAVVFIGVAGILYFSMRDDDEKPGPGKNTGEPAKPDWAVGACVGSGGDGSATPTDPSTASYKPIACDDDGAVAKILELTSEGTGKATCPEDTDVTDADAGSNRAACLRMLAAPHPGDPGEGGGVIRPGDCVKAYNDATELKCEGSQPWYGKVSGTAETYEGCPSETYDAVKRTGSGPKVVCLGRGGKVYTPGMCVKKLPKGHIKSIASLQVDCGSDDAWGKVTSLEHQTTSCSDKVWIKRDAEDSYRRVICLRKL